MLLIVGLGNPGPRYEYTRHNAGFMAALRLADKAGLAPAERFRENLVTNGLISGVRAIVAWPQTFMNLSGLAIIELAIFYKITGHDILVIHDDMDLPLGRLKLSLGGGSAGHKGLDSLINSLKADFCRLKIGIGRPAGVESACYVLERFSSLELPIVEDTLELAAEAAMIWAGSGLAVAQNKVNRRQSHDFK